MSNRSSGNAPQSASPVRTIAAGVLGIVSGLLVAYGATRLTRSADGADCRWLMLVVTAALCFGFAVVIALIREGALVGRSSYLPGATAVCAFLAWNIVDWILVDGWLVPGFPYIRLILIVFLLAAVVFLVLAQWLRQSVVVKAVGLAAAACGLIVAIHVFRRVGVDLSGEWISASTANGHIWYVDRWIFGAFPYKSAPKNAATQAGQEAINGEVLFSAYQKGHGFVVTEFGMWRNWAGPTGTDFDKKLDSNERYRYWKDGAAYRAERFKMLGALELITVSNRSARVLDPNTLVITANVTKSERWFLMRGGCAPRNREPINGVWRFDGAGREAMYKLVFGGDPFGPARKFIAAKKSGASLRQCGVVRETELPYHAEGDKQVTYLNDEDAAWGQNVVHRWINGAGLYLMLMTLEDGRVVGRYFARLGASCWPLHRIAGKVDDAGADLTHFSPDGRELWHGRAMVSGDTVQLAVAGHKPWELRRIGEDDVVAKIRDTYLIWKEIEDHAVNMVLIGLGILLAAVLVVGLFFWIMTPGGPISVSVEVAERMHIRNLLRLFERREG